MNTRTTWLLLLTALLLAAYVGWSERRPDVAVLRSGGVRVEFAVIDPASISGIELSHSNRVLSVVWTNDVWRMTRPLPYAVQSASVDRFLEALGRLQPTGYVPENQLKDGLRAFGLEGDGGTLLSVTRTAAPPIRLRIGARAPLGSRFYFRRDDDPGVFLADAAFLDALPAEPGDWRDRALLEMPPGGVDRIEVIVAGDTHFEAVRGSGGWQLSKPLSARADSSRIRTLLSQLAATRVESFVADGDGGDPGLYGLATPEVELVLARGNVERVRLQFGSVTTNDPALRTVRRGPEGNLVRVAAGVVAPLRQPVNEFRDRRLLPDLASVDRIDLLATNTFRVERNGTNWTVEAPSRFPVPSGIMEHFRERFAALEVVEFVNDVATEPARYGFDHPVRDYLLSQGTNPVARLQIGTPVPGSNGVLVHARRADEPAVYALPVSVLTQLAGAAVQLRDWRFSPADVRSVEVTQQGRTRRLERTDAGWRVAGEPAGRLVDEALDETLHHLGRLESSRYAIPDPDAFVRGAHVDEVAYRLVLEFGPGAPLRRWELNFGGRLANQILVMARFDGDPAALRLEVPEALFVLLRRDFAVPAPGP